MRRFGLLLLAASLASPSEPFRQIFMDASMCVHLRCEWRGVGKHCKPAISVPRGVWGWSFRFLNEDESDDELLVRVKRDHPVNTFTIVKDVALDEMCKEKVLWCNAASQFFSEGYEEFLANLRHPIPELRPKLQC